MEKEMLLMKKVIYLITLVLLLMILSSCGSNSPSITITPNPSIAAYAAIQLTATATYPDNTTQDISSSSSWSSSDTTIATIDSYGLVTGVKKGTTTITVDYGKASGTTTLTVTAPVVKVGSFIDSAVGGLRYESGGQSGETDASGNFNYEDGNTVTFTVGGITVGTATGQSMITPVTLVSGAKDGTNTTVTNITRFLMTIDDDHNPNNGITITAAVQKAAAGKSVNFAVSTDTFTGNTSTIINTLTTATTAGVTTLVTASTAQTHLANTTVISSIAVTPAKPSIASGTTQQFTATGTSPDGATHDITTSVAWSSSSTGVATIDNASGLATSAATGTTTITATSGSVSGTTKLTVTDATLSSIAVTPTNPSIANGAKQFIATGTYSDKTTQVLTTSVTWSSSSTGVATISNAAGSNGLATSVSAGSTTITATSGSLSGTTTLTVTSATLSSIAVTPTNPSIALGTTKQFIATGTYSDSTTQVITTSVTWSSSSTGVATISNAAGSNGLATSVATGSTTITATLSGVSGTTSLTVTSATLSSIAVTPTNPSIANGTTKQFVATGTYSDNTTQVLTTSVTWSSSSTGVATISNVSGSNGLATSVATGSTTITATLSGVSGTTSLTVTSATLSSIAVTPTNPTIANGQTKLFIATGTYSDSTTSNLTTTVTWTSSNTGYATISNTTGSNGAANNGLATSVATGSTTITATSGSVSGTTTLTVSGAIAATTTVNGIDFIFVKGGCFQMGDTIVGGHPDELPVHTVCLDDFYIGKYEVTQTQWTNVKGSNPSNYTGCGGNCPVELVSWNDIQSYLTTLNGSSDGKYSLPTEAQWEYACRSGGQSQLYSGGSNVDLVAWYSSNSGNTTHLEGTKSANGLGIYDMSGNVWEWVQDWYAAYSSVTSNNPVNNTSGSARVVRGGCWGNDAEFTRCARRLGSTPDYRNASLGFRLMRTP
jgi:formylglycine-generating enzyme required for sulfatase activity